MSRNTTITDTLRTALTAGVPVQLYGTWSTVPKTSASDFGDLHVVHIGAATTEPEDLLLDAPADPTRD